MRKIIRKVIIMTEMRQECENGNEFIRKRKKQLKQNQHGTKLIVKIVKN